MRNDYDDFGDGYGSNTAARCCAELRMGVASDPDPDKCACRGAGWILSSFDTWEKCPLHNGPHPEEVMEAMEAEEWAKNHPEEVAALKEAARKAAEVTEVDSDDDLPF